MDEQPGPLSALLSAARAFLRRPVPTTDPTRPSLYRASDHRFFIVPVFSARPQNHLGRVVPRGSLREQACASRVLTSQAAQPKRSDQYPKEDSSQPSPRDKGSSYLFP